MKNLCLFPVLGILTSSLAFGTVPEVAPSIPNPFGTTIEKGHHTWPRGRRGPRGHRGHKGHQGLPGPTGNIGPSIEPAYISLSYIGPPMDISPKPGVQPILPLGIVDTSQPLHFLQYIDPDPLNPAADRYIQVLPGGAGIYIVQFTIYAQTPPLTYPYTTEIGLELQAETNDGTGWTMNIPFNEIQTDLTPAFGSTEAYISSAGTTQGMIYLGEGYKLRAVVLAATDGLTIGLNSTSSVTSRDVGVAMQRVATVP